MHAEATSTGLLETSEKEDCTRVVHSEKPKTWLSCLSWLQGQAAPPQARLQAMSPLGATDDMAMWPCPCMSGGKTYLKADRTGKRREREGEKEGRGRR